MEHENLASFFTNPEDGDEERNALATAFCTNANSIEALKNLVDCGLDSFLTKDELDSWEWTFLDWSVESFSVDQYVDIYQIASGKGQLFHRHMSVSRLSTLPIPLVFRMPAFPSGFHF